LHHCACHGSDQSIEGRESAPTPEYEGGDGSTETGQTQKVNAVRQKHGVGPSIGETADRLSFNVSEPGAPDPEVPWSLEGLQAAQKTDKDIAIIIQLLEKSTEKPAWKEVALAPHDVKTLWVQWSIEEALRIRRRLDRAMAGGLADFTPRGIPRVDSRRDDGRTLWTTS